MHGVEQHLGRQPPGRGVRVVDAIVGIPRFVATDNWYVRELQISRISACTLNPLFDELRREVVQEFRIAGRIPGADVVDRSMMPTPVR